MEAERLLILTPRYPYPVIGGDRLRIYQIAKALRSRFSLTLLSFCENEIEEQHQPDDDLFKSIYKVRLPKWKSYLNTFLSLPTGTPLQLSYYRSSRFQDLVDKLLPEHDLALAHLIRTGQYLEHQTSRPRILEMTDAISLNYLRISNLKETYSWKSFVYKLERKRLDRYERQTVGRFEKVWLTSEIDREFLASESHSKFEVIPNAVDLDLFPFVPSTVGDTIVFIGNLQTVQNLDACLYFANNVLPLVRKHANVRFRIVGNLPSEARHKLQGLNGVDLTGRVNRIADYIEDAFCSVCPIRAGAGIQNKLLEYLALGLPCVASQVGCEGLGVIHGEHVLQYSSAEEAAKYILQLHCDGALARKLSHQGRNLVTEHYDRNHVHSRFIVSAEAALTA